MAANTAGEQVLAEGLKGSNLEIARLVNELTERNQRLEALTDAYQEVRHVLTKAQKEKLGLTE